MKVFLKCRSCSKQLIEWTKPEISEQDAIELMASTFCDYEECDLFIELYSNSGELLATVDEPTTQPEELPPTYPWWMFWK